MWVGDTVLQYGSFTISRDTEREARVFRLGSAELARLAEETATLQDALGAAPTRERVVAAAVEGIARHLGVELRPGRVEASERERALALLGETSAEVMPSRGRVRGSM